MPQIQDQAVCIRSRDYSETSQIVTLFGRQTGKLHALAKGSRRPNSKFGGGIDLLTAGEIFFVPSRGESNLATLTEFELQQAYPHLRRNLLSLHCSEYIAALLAEFTEDCDPHVRLFEALTDTLQQLSQTNRPELTLLNFELILLREIGLAPVWDRCSCCSRPISSDPNLYFSSQNSGMICRDCEPAIMEKRLLEPQVLTILQKPTLAQKAPRNIVIKAHELLSYHQRELAGKDSVVTNFVNQLLRKSL